MAPDNGIGYEEVQKNQGDTNNSIDMHRLRPRATAEGSTTILTVRGLQTTRPFPSIVSRLLWIPFILQVRGHIMSDNGGEVFGKQKEHQQPLPALKQVNSKVAQTALKLSPHTQTVCNRTAIIRTANESWTFQELLPLANDGASLVSLCPYLLCHILF